MKPRTITDSELAQARDLASENYETWGQWVVECLEPEEVRAELSREKSLAAWVRLRKTIGDHHAEIENTAF